MTPSVSTPKDQAREGANQARHLTVSEPTERHLDAIYVHDEDDNDIATFFHSEHATVGQDYETALRLATLLVEVNNRGGAPSPGDPVRAALEGESHEREIEAIAEHLHEEREYRSWTWPTHPDDEGYRGGGYVTITPPDVQALLREEAGRILTRVDQLRQRAALSVSTPTGEGERRIEATQITLGEGMVDIGPITHEGKTGVLFRPRNEHVLFGESGQLQNAQYWPVPGDVVLWVSGKGPGVAIEALAALAHPSQEGERDGDQPEIIQHVKSKGLYEVVTRDAQVQTDTPLSDYAFVCVYRNAITGATWVRPVAEMNDGRFVTLRPTAPLPPSESSGEEA